MNNLRVKKILLCEDEEFYQKTLSFKLKSSGYKVSIVKNGEEAIDALKNDTFDVILLDLIMPQKDGFDTLREIRQMKVSTPVIVLSNLGQEQDKQKVFDLGATEYIVKSDMPLFEVMDKIGKLI